MRPHSLNCKFYCLFKYPIIRLMMNVQVETCSKAKILKFQLFQRFHSLQFVYLISKHNGMHITLQQYVSVLTTERWLY